MRKNEYLLNGSAKIVTGRGRSIDNRGKIGGSGEPIADKNASFLIAKQLLQTGLRRSSFELHCGWALLQLLQLSWVESADAPALLESLTVADDRHKRQQSHTS